MLRKKNEKRTRLRHITRRDKRTRFTLTRWGYETRINIGKTSLLIMTDRICGGHCPIEHISDSTTINCRKCGSSFHLPCYDVIVPKAKLFVSSNIVFICDACLIDIGKSPKRKGPTAVNLKQSVLAPKSNGNVGFLSPQGTPTTSKVTSKASNEQLITMMASMQKKLDEHTKKLDKIDEHVDGTKDGMVKLHQMQSDVFNFVTSRSAFSGAPQVMAHERFRPHTAQNKANESKTPKVNDKQFGANIRTYSTVVQTKLPVTPFSETPRKRETTISLIHNATGQTVQSMKFPTPSKVKKMYKLGDQSKSFNGQYVMSILCRKQFLFHRSIQKQRLKKSQITLLHTLMQKRKQNSNVQN